MKLYKNIPTFRNLVEEDHFWQKSDSSKYIDWSKAKLANFPNLRPSQVSRNLEKK